MSDHGRAGQHRGTSSRSRRVAQALQDSATAALLRAEVLSGRFAAGEASPDWELRAFVRAARELDRDATAFVRDLRLARDDPAARETALVLDRVIAAIGAVRRTLDLVIDARRRGGERSPEDVEEPLPA